MILTVITHTLALLPFSSSLPFSSFRRSSPSLLSLQVSVDYARIYNFTADSEWLEGGTMGEVSGRSDNSDYVSSTVETMEGEEGEETPLPDGWVEVADEATGYSYFNHVPTDTSSWERPVVGGEIATAAAAKAEEKEEKEEKGGGGGGGGRVKIPPPSPGDSNDGNDGNDETRRPTAGSSITSSRRTRRFRRKVGYITFILTF
jgi:hypothetical protein